MGPEAWAVNYGAGHLVTATCVQNISSPQFLPRIFYSSYRNASFNDRKRSVRAIVKKVKIDQGRECVIWQIGALLYMVYYVMI